MRPLLLILCCILACLCAAPVSAQCAGGSCSVRPARAAARGVKSLAGRVREARPARRLLGRVFCR